jgi:hypothetical protein
VDELPDVLAAVGEAAGAVGFADVLVAPLGAALGAAACPVEVDVGLGFAGCEGFAVACRVPLGPGTPIGAGCTFGLPPWALLCPLMAKAPAMITAVQPAAIARSDQVPARPLMP